MNEKEIFVSVFCTVYNHEKSIRKCLDSLVNQKTDFNYEILVNDDASTDLSVNILKEYEKKYSDIIKVVYQKENQFSKGVNIINEVLFPISKGKYITFCEGDDSWCDENKLQIQYDFMKEHPECSMCVHNTIFNDQLLNKKTLFNNWQEIYELTAKDVFEGWKIHLTSYFLKREYVVLPEKLLVGEVYGDYNRRTFAFGKGKIYSLPYVMSIYNYGNINGIVQTAMKDRTKGIVNMKDTVEYLNRLNVYFNYRFDEEINNQIFFIKQAIFMNFAIIGVSKEEYSYLVNDLNIKYLNRNNLFKSFKDRIIINLLMSNFYIFKLMGYIKRRLL